MNTGHSAELLQGNGRINNGIQRGKNCRREARSVILGLKGRGWVAGYFSTAGGDFA